MLWRLQLLALLGVASASGDSFYHDGSLRAAANPLLWPAVASNPDVAKHIIDVENALGMCNLTIPTQQSNPEPLQQGPAVQVPETLPAPWHAIAEPPNAVCAVSSTLVWLLSRMYLSALCGTSSSLRLQNTPFVQPFAHVDAHHVWTRHGGCTRFSPTSFYLSRLRSHRPCSTRTPISLSQDGCPRMQQLPRWPQSSMEQLTWQSGIQGALP